MNTDPGTQPRAANETIERGSRRPSLGSTHSTGVVLVPAGGVFEGQIAIMGQTCIEGTVRGSLCGTGELELGKVKASRHRNLKTNDPRIIGSIQAYARGLWGRVAAEDGRGA